ncbi:LysR family transcriptional regulator [Actinocorallia aurea]
MEVESLRWFLSLCETENMRDTAAAERINQSTLSRALARLEADLGVELFHRHGRRLALSRFGVLYRDHAARAVAELDRARRRIDALADPDTGLIRLGFLHSTGRWLVPQILRDHRAVTPGIRFELRQGFARELYAWLRDGEIDAALATPPPDGSARWHSLHEQPLFLALPADHPLAARPHPTLRDLRTEPFVAFGPSTDLRRVIDEMCLEAGFAPRIAFESEEIATVRALIGAGLGVGVLPLPESGDTSTNPAYRPLLPARHRPIGLAWNPHAHPTPATAAFLSRITT